MKRIIASLVIGMCIGGVAQASGSGKMHWTRATIRCQYDLTEDTAAHIKLVRYEPTAHGLIIGYQCTKGW